MESDLKRSIILDHYQRPFNKGLVNDDNYIKINVNNESCIDNINLMMKIEDNIIKDIKFDGEACAISTSATSIITKILIGKTVTSALEFINDYENMINEQTYNAEKLGEAIVYEDIYKQPNRKKCALLPIVGLKKLLEEFK
ncbi:MAG: SUF system NifU family Fe-S cluster assembly protein [Bacilli bacterium]|nr:SUF system NifU family Fe-S cluster assembly protein [Bacilli bacterium]